MTVDCCFFSDLNTFNDERKNPQVYFTYLLFHFILAVKSNCFGIQALTSTMFENEKRDYAIGIFSKAASLLNHSCNPNTSVVFVKDEQITFATKQIVPGEEICHIYKCHFVDNPLEKRQNVLLNSYHFKCTCKACVNNYLTLNELPHEFEDEEYKDLEEKAKQAFQAREFKQATQYFARKLKIASEKLQEPHQVFIKDRALLITSISEQFGNKTLI